MWVEDAAVEALRSCSSAGRGERVGRHGQVQHQQPKVVAAAEWVESILGAEDAVGAVALIDGPPQEGHRPVHPGSAFGDRDARSLATGEHR